MSGDGLMKTLTAYTSHISNKRSVFHAGIIALCVMLLLGGCGNAHRNNAYRQLDDLIDTFEAELKKDFSYVKEINCHTTRGNAEVSWYCAISEEKTIDELSELIICLKEFALREDLFEAMKNTGNYYSEYTSDINVVVTKDAWIYDAVTSYKRDFVWSDEENTSARTPETGSRLDVEDNGDVYKHLSGIIDSFEAEIKEEFPYVDVIFEQGRGPADLFDLFFYGSSSTFVFWGCYITEEKTVKELSELITRIKEFTLRADVLEALENTGNYDTKSETFAIRIGINTKEEEIYHTETSRDRDLLWSD
jgi:hypothetical protein